MAESRRSEEKEKKQIYFFRTYRHWKIKRLTTVLFLLLFVLPLTILIFFFYDEMTWLLCKGAEWILRTGAKMEPEMLTSVFLPRLGEAYYLSLPTKLPGYGLILANLAVSLALIWVLCFGAKGQRPISIYLIITLFIHVISCAFFLLGRDLFPYTLADFSDLYIKQQIGIWITFLVLMGIIMGLLGRGGILRRVITVLSVMLYSFVFGFVRYVFFLWVLSAFSVLYMPIMFFALGPLFDFLYFVAVYAISTDRTIYIYQTKRKGEWEWA